MKTEVNNEATALMAHLGVYSAMLGSRFKFRGPTPERTMRKGEDGLRKPGRYGKGLRNWMNAKPSKGRV